MGAETASVGHQRGRVVAMLAAGLRPHRRVPVNLALCPASTMGEWALREHEESGQGSDI